MYQIKKYLTGFKTSSNVVCKEISTTFCCFLYIRADTYGKGYKQQVFFYYKI